MISCPGFWSLELRERVRENAEKTLLDPKPNVRFAAKRLLAALFLSDDVCQNTALAKRIARYRKAGVIAQRAAQRKIAEAIRMIY